MHSIFYGYIITDLYGIDLLILWKEWEKLKENIERENGRKDIMWKNDGEIMRNGDLIEEMRRKAAR